MENYLTAGHKSPNLFFKNWRATGRPLSKRVKMKIVFTSILIQLIDAFTYGLYSQDSDCIVMREEIRMEMTVSQWAFMGFFKLSRYESIIHFLKISVQLGVNNLLSIIGNGFSSSSTFGAHEINIIGYIIIYSAYVVRTKLMINIP